MLKFTCSNCNHKIGAPEKYAGKRVRCPKCKAPTRVPESVEKTGPQQPRLIKFRCPACNQKIGVTPDYAGKRVRCSKCKNPLRVPQALDQSGRSTVKDETAVLRAGQEQHPADGGVWGDMASVDELLLAEANAPSAERQMEQSPVDYRAGESELPAYTSQLPQTGSFAQSSASREPSKKRRSIFFIGAACVLGLLVVGIVVWYFPADSGTVESERKVELQEVREFAEQYIVLLEDGEIDRARELLSPALQTYVQKDDIERLARQTGKSNIVELDCEQTHFEEHPEGS